MATLGYTSVGVATDSNGTDVIALCGWFQTDNGGGLVGSGWARMTSLAGAAGGRSQKVRMLLYADSGGAPTTTLVGATDEVTVTTATPAPSWVEFPGWTSFGGAPRLPGNTKYWVGFWWGTVVSSANFAIAEDVPGPQPAHQFSSVTATYSSSGSPPVASWTDSGGFQTDSMYFDYTNPSLSYIPSLGRRPVPMIKGPDIDRIMAMGAN